MGFIDGRMDQFTKAIGLRTKYQDMGSTHGMITGPIKAIGKTITCMVREFINGLMVESMKENMLMIKNMAMVFILIRMVVLIGENGLMASNMGKGYLLLLRDQRKKGFGMKAKE
jgi:hypothetical protein